MRSKKTTLVGIAPIADEHKYITRGENVVLVGGNKETHGKMQEIAGRFNDDLKRDHRNINEITRRELVDRLRNAIEKTLE